MVLNINALNSVVAPVYNSTTIAPPMANVGLIIGLSVGLGGFFILLTVIVITAAVINAVIAYIHAKKKQKQEEENQELTSSTHL